MARVRVRYIVTNVAESIAFYTEHLGFALDLHPAPPFAMLSRGDLQLLLSEPGAGGGGHAMPGGQAPQPGGWNRFLVEVEDLMEMVARLEKAGCSFRNEIVVGVGGSQIILNDPSGNPVELFQAK